MLERSTIWKTTDGRAFDTKKEAIKEQKVIDMYAGFEERPLVVGEDESVTEVLVADLVEYVRANKELFVQLLKVI